MDPLKLANSIAAFLSKNAGKKSKKVKGAEDPEDSDGEVADEAEDIKDKSKAMKKPSPKKVLKRVDEGK